MNIHKFIGAHDRSVVTRAEGKWGESKIGNWGNFMVAGENQTCGGKHNVVYIDAELQCCTPDLIHVT